ncbi:hypothetical protein CMK14_02645 [Candidatus Poribacteria bacterium]|jgi:cell division protein FtsB|nr:hypothetical protein [Candidatus Poribacteria bacterium]
MQLFTIATIIALAIAIFATYWMNAIRIKTAIKGPNFQIHQLTNEVQRLKVRVSELEDELTKLKNPTGGT